MNNYNYVNVIAGSTASRVSNASVFCVLCTSTTNTKFRHWLTVWNVTEARSTLCWTTARLASILCASS